jgi:hypothetical protein
VPAPRVLLFGLAPGDAYRAVCVTTDAVGSYPTVSPLPEPNGVLLGHRRFVFCGAGVGLLRLGVTQRPALGVRTFLPLVKSRERSPGLLPRARSV